MLIRCPVCNSLLQYENVKGDDIIYCPRDKSHHVISAIKNKTLHIPYIHS